MKKYIIPMLLAVVALLVPRHSYGQFGLGTVNVTPATQYICSSGVATITATGATGCTAATNWSGTYQWYVSTDMAVWSPVAGATGAISYASPAAVFTPSVTGAGSITYYYYKVVISAITSPCLGVGPTLTSAPVTVVVPTAPPGPVTGTLSICDGTSTTLSAMGGGTWTTSGAATATIGVLTGVATGLSSGTCTVTCNNNCGIASAVLTVNPYPATFAATGGGGFCAGSSGVAVGLAGSVTGITYQLFRGGTGLSTLAGTGSSLNFGLQSVTGTYTIRATDDITTCTGTTATTSVVSNPPPTQYYVEGGGGYCAGGPGAVIQLSGTNPGVAYQLYNGTSAVGSAVAGTGSWVSFGTHSTTGTYSVIGTNMGSGCTAPMLGTVNVFGVTPPGAISGTLTVCPGGTTTLSNTTPGGTWSVSNTSVATVSSAGVATGITAGTDMVTYGISGCFVTETLTVTALPASITGPTTVCQGATATKSFLEPGGTWASANPAVATIDPVTGVVTGINAGVATLSYTLAAGCIAYSSITVLPAPALITGPATVCVGGSTTLFSPPGGGTWMSVTSSVAVSGSGIVTGLSFGTGIITYTASNGCFVTKVISVNALPSPPATSLCIGQSATAAAGTTMVSGTSSVAMVTGGGTTIIGLSSGTSLVTYTTTSTGCAVTSPLTVNAAPTITGAPSVCQYSTTTLSSSIPGGTWSSSVPTAATVNTSGVIAGLAAGTSVISYVAPAGCGAFAIATVVAAPAAISGTLSACVGSNTTLSSSPAGGTWSTSAGWLSVGLSTGIVSGLSTGTAEVTYTAPSGCNITALVTINVTSPIVGSPSICSGLSTTFTNASAGGTWSGSNDAIATIGSATGIVSAFTGGAVTITYSGAGCGAVTAPLSVVAGTAPITGSLSVCHGQFATLSSGTGGGVWESSDLSVVTVGSSTGVIMGASPGTAIVTYTAGSCGSVTATVTVNALPAPIAGTSSVCPGYNTTLSNSNPGGTWSIAPASIASVVATTGGVTGVAPGTATVSYTLTTGCRATAVVTVDHLPVIGGTLSICATEGTTLSSSPAGGFWTSYAPTIVSVSGSGIVAGVGPGVGTITYAQPSGCMSTVDVTVNVHPAPITGSSSVCVGALTTLSSTTSGGSWSASPLAVASIGSATGAMVGASTGTATIYYSMPTGCAASKIVTVLSVPAAITGPATVCPGGTVTLTSASVGGSWTTGSSSVATIGAGTGIVMGSAAGTSVITYTIPGGCYTTYAETVNPPPGPITGVLSLCVGSSATLSDATPGGSWSSSSPGIAAVSVAGVLSTFSVGTATITYSLPSTGCFITTNVTVNAMPAAITGGSSVCMGGIGTLSSATSGGTWTSGAPSTLTVDPATGVIGGISLGSAVVTYTLAACTRMTTINVTSAVAPITGTLSVCQATTTALSSGTTGGTWSSGAGATVSTVGVVTGVSLGTTMITYSAGSCGSVYATVTVNAPATVFSVVGGGPYCSTTTGAAVGLSGSEVGVTYRLYSGSSMVAGPVLGTGSALILGTMTAGSYSVRATNAAGCVANMLGIATNTFVAAPIQHAVTGGGVYCTGLGGATIGLSGSNTGINYQLYNGSTAVGGFIPGTGGPITIGIFTVAGTYSVVATSVASGCSIAMSGTRNITVSPGCSGTPVAGVVTASSTSACVGSSIFLTLTGATMACGVTYQWQYSTDGVAWTDITGANVTVCTLTVASTRYYRCAVSCAASGITAYSSTVHIFATYSITAHSVVTSDTPCSATHFYIASCNTSAALSVLTYFGDGSSASNALTSWGSFSAAHIYHVYASPGTYTVKQVLYFSGVAYDSVTFSHEYYHCHTLAVKFYRDNNTNCLFDAGDLYNTASVTTEVDSNGVPVDTIVATGGFYYGAFGPAGTIYAFRVLSATGGMGVACPVTGILYDTIVSSAIYPIRYFGMQCSSPDFDLVESVSTTSATWLQSSTIFLSNTYCTAVNPIVTMHFSPHYVYGWASPAPSYISGNTLVWNMAALSSSTAYSPYITVHLNAVSFIAPGDTVHSDFLAAPLVGDINTANNYVEVVRTVTGSCDPNEISVSPGGFILPCTELQYTVDFENVGNDTAHNIYVLDTLSNDLDPHSLAVSYASHVMNISMINDGGYKIAKFDFPDINLLDSSHRNLCHGKFIYTIRARSSIPIGAGIPNRAGIYFDNNPVVLTNTIANTVGIAPVSGPSSLCTGFSGIFSDATTGGAWHTGDPLIASVTTPGTISAHRVGTSVVSYTASNSCSSLTATKTVTIDSSYVPVVTMAAHPGTYITIGQHDTLVASVAGAGPTPAYRWLVNGIPQAGAIGTLFASSSFADGDSVVCEVMGSGDCGLPSYNFVIMHVSTGASSVVQKEGVTLYPNPSSGAFTITGAVAGDDVQVEVRNTLGQLVHSETVRASNGHIGDQLQLDKSLPNGMYTVILRSGNERTVLHFVLAQ